MVGDALKVADGLEQFGRLFALVAAHFLRAELDEIGSEDILIVVAALFIVADALGELRCVVAEGGEGVVQRAHGAVRHLASDGAALAKGERRRGEQTLVELGRLFALRLGIVGDDALGELFKKTARGQEHGSAENIECRVRHGDARHGGGFVQQRGRKGRAHDAEDRQQHDNADDIEEQVDDRGAAGILVCADRRQHGCDGRADVLTHDDGDGRGVAHRARDGERLQNTDGRRARLNDGGEQRAGEHAEDGILKSDKEICERGDVLEACDRAAHRLHAEHERGKAEQDHAGVLFLVVLAEHVVDDANQRKDRGER